MHKKILLSLIIGVALVFSCSVLAEENNQPENNQSDEIIETINNEAGPIFQNIVNSFKNDVWDKTAIWLEKTKSIKEENSSFFSVIHKFFTGKDDSQE
jgi:peptidoglycan hydrolase CwlO-like protein